MLGKRSDVVTGSVGSNYKTYGSDIVRVCYILN